MILTENQNLQLTVILMEAAEDQGDKQGFLKKAKEFFKRILAIITERIKKFTSFLKEKVKSLEDHIYVLIKRLKGKDSQNAKYSTREERFNTEKAKKRYADFKKLNSKMKEGISDLTLVLKGLNAIPVLKQKGKGPSDEEYKNMVDKTHEMIDDVSDHMFEIGEYFKNFSNSNLGYKAANKDKVSSIGKETLSSLDEFMKLINDNKDISYEYMKLMTSTRNFLKRKMDELDEATDSKFIRAMSKFNSLLSKTGSLVTGFWSKIFSFVTDLIGRKKKDEE